LRAGGYLRAICAPCFFAVGDSLGSLIAARVDCLPVPLKDDGGISAQSTPALRAERPAGGPIGPLKALRTQRVGPRWDTRAVAADWRRRRRKSGHRGEHGRSRQQDGGTGKFGRGL
jgi:hypothetical protein